MQRKYSLSTYILNDDICQNHRYFNNNKESNGFVWNFASWLKYINFSLIPIILTYNNLSLSIDTYFLY